MASIDYSYFLARSRSSELVNNANRRQSRERRSIKYIKPGADPFLYMSMVYTFLDENLVDKAFVREQTDLILLVRDDNRKLLRESDLEPEGSDEVFYLWDEKTKRAVKYKWD